MVEILTVISITAVMGAITMPRIEGLFAFTSVKSARASAAAQFRTARTAASHGGRTAIVRVAGDRIWVEARPRTTPLAGSTADTVSSVIALSRDHQVGVYASFDSIVYDPRGIGTNGGVLVVTRGGSRDSVLVTALGMVTR